MSLATEAQPLLAAEGQPILEARGLTKTFGAREAAQTVVDRVDLVLEAGEMVALLGASGSGKSTLLNMIGLLLAPDDGELLIRGERVDSSSARVRSASRLAHVSHVFQAFHLIEHKTVAENVELPLIHAGVPKAERREQVAAVLESVGLEHRTSASPATLSGGEKQRVAIARALVTRPDVLLCDEPTGSLDTARSAEVIDLLRAVTRATSATVIVTHDPEVAAQCDRVLRLVDGRIVEERVGDVLREDMLREDMLRGTVSTGDVLGAEPEDPAPGRSRWGRTAWGQAWDAFTGRFARNLYTQLGVALGVSALVLSVGFAGTVSAQLSHAFDAFLADRVTVSALSAGKPVRSSAQDAAQWAQSLDAQRVRGIQGVRDLGFVQAVDGSVDIQASAEGSSPSLSVTAAGATTEGLRVLEVHAAQGRLFDDGHVARADRVALLREGVLASMGRPWTPGLEITLNGERLSVIGTVKDYGDARGAAADLYVPLGVSLGAHEGTPQMIVLVNPGAAEVVTGQLPAAVNPAQPQNVGASAPPEPKSLRQAVDSQQQLLMLGMSGLTLFIAGIGIMNTFIVAVMERRKEIGLRMALGAPPRAIGLQFCWEAVLTALAGSAIGVVFSVNVLFVIAALNGWTPVLSAGTVMLGLGAGLAVGTGAGILPAVRAASVDPVESLQQS